MNNAVKLWLTLGSLLVVAIFVIQATKPSGSIGVPTAYLSNESFEATGKQELFPSRVTEQPTILRAKPITAEGGASSPRYAPGPFRQQENDSPLDRRVPDHSGSAVPILPAGDTTSAGGVQPAAGGFPGGGPPVQDPLTPVTRREIELGRVPARESETVAAQAVYQTVQNDSFWRISERRYGVGDYYRALYAHNRDKISRPDRIEAGIEIETPDVARLRRLYPELCPPADGR